MTTIHFIAAAHRRFGETKVFVQSLINQTSGNWLLTVIHDGPSDEFNNMMQRFKNQYPQKIEFFCTEKRFNDYGHSLRELGLNRASGNFVLLTNTDNYFIPKAVEYLVEAVGQGKPDVVLFDMVHSHNTPGGRQLGPYSFFETSYERGSIDISSAMVETSLAKKVGFRDKTHDGDATYFEDIVNLKGDISLVKIPKILFVHN